jgi:hypothetical protein
MFCFTNFEERRDLNEIALSSPFQRKTFIPFTARSRSALEISPHREAARPYSAQPPVDSHCLHVFRGQEKGKL